MNLNLLNDFIKKHPIHLVNTLYGGILSSKMGPRNQSEK